MAEHKNKSDSVHYISRHCDDVNLFYVHKLFEHFVPRQVVKVLLCIDVIYFALHFKIFMASNPLNSLKGSQTTLSIYLKTFLLKVENNF
jgi:hypothetical protein